MFYVYNIAMYYKLFFYKTQIIEEYFWERVVIFAVSTPVIRLRISFATAEFFHDGEARWYVFQRKPLLKQWTDQPARALQISRLSTPIVTPLAAFSSFPVFRPPFHPYKQRVLRGFRRLRRHSNCGEHRPFKLVPRARTGTRVFAPQTTDTSDHSATRQIPRKKFVPYSASVIEYRLKCQLHSGSSEIFTRKEIDIYLNMFGKLKSKLIKKG